jgi:retron-type reverse transcriptase
MDYLLSAVAKRFGLKYSRYADDMTFSSMHNVFQQDSEFLKELHRIVFEQGFHIKESKTRLQKEGFRQEVTGLLVNEKVNVQKKYIKQLREWLYKWETYGYNKANSFFIQNYVKEKGNVKKGIPNMTMVLDGKLQYLKMVKGDKDGTYLKLKERFDALYSITSPINSILDIWENEGIDKAMEAFYLQNPKKSSVKVASNEQLDNVFNFQFIL